MEGLPELGEYRQRLLGVQRDGGGHESRRFLERAPGKIGRTTGGHDCYCSKIGYIKSLKG
jgi:hypothetical protein